MVDQKQAGLMIVLKGFDRTFESVENETEYASYVIGYGRANFLIAPKQMNEGMKKQFREGLQEMIDVLDGKKPCHTLNVPDGFLNKDEKDD